MRHVRIGIPKDRVAEFCRRHHIRWLALFGSVLRDDFRSTSDVDVLVEFEPGRAPGLAFFSLESELSEILGRRVDLNTPAFLSKYFRERSLADAEVQYVAPSTSATLTRREAMVETRHDPALLNSRRELRSGGARQRV